MIRRPPRSTPLYSSAASDVYKRQEELQSINEELTTVNVELQTNLTDLAQVNSDMDNMLDGSGVDTVFVDHRLRILRFTPRIAHIINLIPSDIGRPIDHIVSNLGSYDRLVEDARTVLDTLVSREAEVQSLAGEWYAMRILPYRTLGNVVEGVAITVSYTHLRAHETKANLVCRLLLEKKKK